jgi:hypothetical protein
VVPTQLPFTAGPWGRQQARRCGRGGARTAADHPPPALRLIANTPPGKLDPCGNTAPSSTNHLPGGRIMERPPGSAPPGCTTSVRPARPAGFSCTPHPARTRSVDIYSRGKMWFPTHFSCHFGRLIENIK